MMKPMDEQIIVRSSVGENNKEQQALLHPAGDSAADYEQQQEYEYYDNYNTDAKNSLSSSPVAAPAPPASTPILRRFALFVDGMTRAMILPFGPTLVHRLVYNNATTANMQQSFATTWSGVGYYLGWVVAVYIVGRWLGTRLTLVWQKKRQQQFADNNNNNLLPMYIARLGGMALSLHIFTYGAGLGSVKWLVAIRILSGLLAGLLCGITQHIALPEDDWVYSRRFSNSAGSPTGSRIGKLYADGEYQDDDDHDGGDDPNSWSIEEERVDALRRREGYVDIASGTAKIYLTGFAVSILSGGLLFRSATKDSTFQALTGAYQYSISPLFLIGVAVGLEVVLRWIFALAARKKNPTSSSEVNVLTTTTASGCRVRGVVQRMVGDVSEKTGRDVVVAMEALTNANHGGGMSSPTNFGPLLEEDSHIEDGLLCPRSIQSERNPYSDADAATSRSRVESYTSIDEFFDCRSVFSDMEEGHTLFSDAPALIFDDGRISPNQNVDENAIAEYKDGKCLYPDGSPAFIPPGECVARIPQCYLDFHKNNEQKARKAWTEAQKWRLEKRVWKIHSRPHHWFNKIKEAYPHFVHGHSKKGYPIVYEQPGRMNLKELFRGGCAISDMTNHYTFFTEFLANRVSRHPDVRRLRGQDTPANFSTFGEIVVMDIAGAGLSQLSGDVVKYLKAAGDMSSSYYPLSMKRAFLVNTPFWLAGAWSGLKGILPESVQVDILSESKYPAALREYIDEDQIPPEYGGTSPYNLGEHPYEIALRDLVESIKDNKDDDDDEERLVAPVSRIAVPSAVGVASTENALDKNHESEMEQLSAFSSPQQVKPMRRRLGSRDPPSSRRTSFSDYRSTPKKAPFSGQRDVFLIVSIMHVLWSMVQGAIEVAIPLWILSPTMLGGLGYSPSRSGVSLFCACLVLLWTLRTKSSKLVSKIPSKSPLRAFRIGAGSESALLGLLAIITTFTSPLARKDSIFVMTATIILFASMALATMIGRSASKILHRIAAESFAYQPRPQLKRDSFLASLIAECETGRFTALLNLVAELAGIFMVAPLWSLSILSERTAPFDGTCILCVSSLITFALYVCSFALYIDAAGEFAPHPSKDSCTPDTRRWRRCGRFVREVIAVSAGDMASLFEESHWSATPLLGRARTFSDSSASMAEMMERGEVVEQYNKSR